MDWIQKSVHFINMSDIPNEQNDVWTYLAISEHHESGLFIRLLDVAGFRVLRRVSMALSYLAILIIILCSII